MEIEINRWGRLSAPETYADDWLLVKDETSSPWLKCFCVTRLRTSHRATGWSVVDADERDVQVAHFETLAEVNEYLGATGYEVSSWLEASAEPIVHPTIRSEMKWDSTQIAELTEAVIAAAGFWQLEEPSAQQRQDFVGAANGIADFAQSEASNARLPVRVLDEVLRAAGKDEHVLSYIAISFIENYLMASLDDDQHAPTDNPTRKMNVEQLVIPELQRLATASSEWRRVFAHCWVSPFWETYPEMKRLRDLGVASR